MKSTTVRFTDTDKAFIDSLPIEAVILFGSQAQNAASKMSDYDVGVIIKPNQSTISRKQRYDALYDLLSNKINRLVNIDIVFLDTTPLELQYHVSKYGIVLYERNGQTFNQFRESVMIKYADFAPLREQFQKATLARIPS